MKRILIADEDGLTRRVVFGALAQSGVEVVDASMASEALQQVQAGTVRVALLDYDLVRRSPELLRDMLAAAPDTRRILLVPAGGGELEDWTDAADERVEKPVTPMNLLRTLSPWLGEPAPLGDAERQLMLENARDLALLRREDERKSRELKEAHARLLEFEKMKDMFLGIVSHELRTPLTAIKASSHLLTRMLRDVQPGTREAKLANVVESLSAGTSRMESLIQELLSYHAVRNGVAPFELKEAQLAPLIASVATEFEPLAERRRIQVIVQVEDDLPAIAGDQPRLREAVTHLVKNAILHNQEGGQVNIRLQADGDGVLLTVVDTGAGISPEERERVFLPFYQSHDVLTRRVEGVGLGLAITRHIVESHNGRITMAGELGKGTEVRVWLPSQPPELAHVEFRPASPGEFQDADPDSLLDYSRELYSALESERVRRRYLEDQYRAMEITFLDTLTALMQQIDMRGAHKGSHVERVMTVANEIARRIDPMLPENRDFQLSLLLHDIGKIGVAENLLQKVGSLSRTEQRQLQAHVTIGAEILGNIKLIEPALQAVRHHHERWDGKGYPDGLAGAQIPLWARIISVADSFDAMTQDRPYRKALTPDQARGEIERNAGTQYDPKVVQAFLDSWGSVAHVFPVGAGAGEQACP